MDAVLTAFVQSLPQMGIGGLILGVLVLLLRRESSTEERHTAEMTRVTAVHDAELAEMRADLREMREAIDRVHRDLDAERSRRRAIEDELAAARRGGAT